MAFRALRPSGAEIDERSARPDESEPTASRRRFLTRAVAGGAIVAGAAAIPLSSLAAQAQTEGQEGTTPGSTPGTTPTPPAPSGSKPLVSGDDLELVVTMQSIELAVIASYDAFVATGKLTSADAETGRMFKLHHEDHEQALAELAGGAAVKEPNPQLEGELVPLIQNAADADELLTIIYNLEESLAATYDLVLGELASFRASAVVSRILPVDGQHAIVWSQKRFPDPNVWAEDITTWIPAFQSQSGAIDLATHPAS
jgi:hypothetical protein